MSGSTAKLIRKIFSDRRQYRWFKKKYQASTTTQKIQARTFTQKLVSSGKKIENSNNNLS